MSANTRVISAAQTALSAQKAFLAILLVLLAMAVFNLNPGTKTNFFSEANVTIMLKSA